MYELDILRWVTAILVTFGLLLVILYFSKTRLNFRRDTVGVKVRSHTLLRNNASLYVIEIENQRLLIGVTKENMTILTCLEPVSTLDEALQDMSK